MSYITGPAALKLGTGPYIYFDSALKSDVKTETVDIKTDFHGHLFKGMVSRKGTISGTPSGNISTTLLAALFPLGVGNVGLSVFGASDAPGVIWSKDGKKNTFQRAGVTQPPGLLLSAGKPLFTGDLQVTTLGAATTSMETAQTAAAHWQAITTAAFADATFDETTLSRYQYTADCGSTPFDAITAQEGFKVDIKYTVEEIKDDNVGIGDIILTGVEVACTFIPSNLDEAHLYTLIKLQDTSALQPGMAINGGGTDLVITGTDGNTGLTLTLGNVGFADIDLMYGTGKLRAGEIQAYAARTFSAGTANPIFTFDVTSGS
jgi:hypothetical protein